MDKKIQNIVLDCLDMLDRGKTVDFCLQKHGLFKQDIQEYLRLVGKLGSLGSFGPSKEFCRSTLAAVRADSRISIKPRRLLLKPALIFVTVFLIVFLSFAGTVFASQQTIPGQTLYPVKRAVENVQLAVYPHSQKEKLHQNLLEKRIQEAEIIIGSQSSGPELADKAVADMEKQYKQCLQYGLPPSIREETAKKMENITSLYRNRFHHSHRKGGHH